MPISWGWSSEKRHATVGGPAEAFWVHSTLLGASWLLNFMVDFGEVKTDLTKCKENLFSSKAPQGVGVVD